MAYLRWSTILGLQAPPSIEGGMERFNWHLGQRTRLDDAARERFPEEHAENPLGAMNIVAAEEGLHISCWYVFLTDSGLEVWNKHGPDHATYDPRDLKDTIIDGSWSDIAGYDRCGHPSCNAAMRRAVTEFTEEDM